MPLKKKLTTSEKYDRMAKQYDLMELLPESVFFGRFRKQLFAEIAVFKGKMLLEVGVGTGKNIPYYPPSYSITAIDFSQEMLVRARKRAIALKKEVDFKLMDVESLVFESNSFDVVVATFVFCSVPDPVKGLSELRRVLKPDGKFYALEHVRPKTKFLGWLFDKVAPSIYDRTGVNINRYTVENIKKAQFEIELEKNLILDVFKKIIAKPIKE